MYKPTVYHINDLDNTIPHGKYKFKTFKFLIDTDLNYFNVLRYKANNFVFGEVILKYADFKSTEISAKPKLAGYSGSPLYDYTLNKVYSAEVEKLFKK